MRLGGHILKDCPDPEFWIIALRYLGYSAAYCPLNNEQYKQESLIQSYAKAAKKANIVIAEVGAQIAI